MISSRTVTIRQYCSVCKATLDMSVVDTVQSDEVTWLKCPRCAGILPHMLSREDVPQAEAPPVTANAEVPAPAAPAAIPELDRSGARDYDSSLTYEVGQIVYHRSMNQYGRVVEKTQLPGNRSVIRVQFEAGEPITLREGQ